MSSLECIKRYDLKFSYNIKNMSVTKPESYNVYVQLLEFMTMIFNEDKFAEHLCNIMKNHSIAPPANTKGSNAIVSRCFISFTF